MFGIDLKIVQLQSMKEECIENGDWEMVDNIDEELVELRKQKITQEIARIHSMIDECNEYGGGNMIDSLEEKLAKLIEERNQLEISKL